MHPRLKRNICFSAGETIYHSPITSDKHSDTSSRSNDEVRTNSVGARELTCTDFHKDSSISFIRLVFFSTTFQDETIIFLCSWWSYRKGPNRTIRLFLFPQWCQGLGFASLLTLELLWTTVIQCCSGRVVSSLSKGKLTHLPSQHWKQISSTLIHKRCTNAAPIKALNESDKLQMVRVCPMLPGEQVYLYIITISVMSFNQTEQTARAWRCLLCLIMPLPD